MKLIAGNWKMNGLGADGARIDALLAAGPPARAALLVCPPFTLIASFVARAGGRIAIGAQDCHPQPYGAHTGDISAPMLADAGASHVILGHSERRADHGETDALVHAKAGAARAAGLVPIVCVGETLAQREAGRTLEVVGRQLSGSVPAGPGPLVVAYEPVWAIGTGHIPTAAQVAEVHAFIAAHVPTGTPLLYGGSVKPDTAGLLLDITHVDGVLVGGASLDPADFLAIAAAAP